MHVFLNKTMQVLYTTIAFLALVAICQSSHLYANGNDNPPYRRGNDGDNPQPYVNGHQRGMTANDEPYNDGKSIPELNANGYDDNEADIEQYVRFLLGQKILNRETEIYPPSSSDKNFDEKYPYMSKKGYPKVNEGTKTSAKSSHKSTTEADKPIDATRNELLQELMRLVNEETDINAKGYDTSVQPETVPPTEASDISQRDIELAMEVADRYIDELEAGEREAMQDSIITASRALSAFRSASERTRQATEQARRAMAELEAITRLSGNRNSLRELEEDDDLLERVFDPTCDMKLDCFDEANRNFVDGVEYSNINGTCNNQQHFQWGMAGVQHVRLLPNAYNNKVWVMRKTSASGGRLPSARAISSIIHSAPANKPDNEEDLAIALFYFMQFIDHDLALTPEGHVDENIDCCNPKDASRADLRFCLPIVESSSGDDYFSDGYCMASRRSHIVRMCEDTKVRNQINDITSYMDASMVYGSSFSEMKHLRTGNGGEMRVENEGFLPTSAHPDELPCNRTSESDRCFEAGDFRVNVHPDLATYHTVFVREHNRIVRELAEIQPGWGDEKLFQEGRKIVIAMIQHITYTSMLPLLFNIEKLVEYGVYTDYRYDKTIDASMTQAFSIAYRYHHLMPSELHEAKFREDGTVREIASVNQEEAILRPHFLTDHNYKGINHVTLGMLHSKCPFVDGTMNNATRNLLFLDANGNSFDLAALNIMRAREWGMPSYTEYRKFCELKPIESWEDLEGIMKPEVIQKLQSVYTRDVRDIDLWTGVVSEIPLPASISGETQTCLLAKHFANLKHGDRFWYENNIFTDDHLAEIQKTTLSRILCSNLGLEKMPKFVFLKESLDLWSLCTDIEKEFGLHLEHWGSRKK